MIPALSTHNEKRAQEWFARLDPVIRKHKLRARPHGMAVLVNALNAAGITANLMTCKIKVEHRQSELANAVSQHSNTYVMVIDGCLVHSHGAVGAQAWKSAHLQAHHRIHAGYQPTKTPFPSLASQDHIPLAARHASGQAGFVEIKPCHSMWSGDPSLAPTSLLYCASPTKDPWLARLEKDILRAISGPVPSMRPLGGLRQRPSPRGLGVPCEIASLQLDALARHWMEYKTAGKRVSASDLLWAAATLLNQQEVASRLWCRPVTRFNEQGHLSSDLAIAVSFRRDGRRYLAHLGDPARWGVPEPRIDGGMRYPDYLAVHFDYLDFKPALEWMAAYSGSSLEKATPEARKGVLPRSRRL